MLTADQIDLHNALNDANARVYQLSRKLIESLNLTTDELATVTKRANEHWHEPQTTADTSWIAAEAFFLREMDDYAEHES